MTFTEQRYTARSREKSAPITALPARARTRLLFLYADTGGGHLASARAVAAEIERQTECEVDVHLFDPTDASWFRPLCRVPRLYGAIVRWIPWLWGLFYVTTNSRPGAKWARRMIGGCLTRSVQRAVEQTNPDVIVCFHALLTEAACAASGQKPWAIVVTDLGAIHACWLHDKADLITMPSTSSVIRARASGIGDTTLVDTGLPVANAFSKSSLSTDWMERERLRLKLGLDDRFTVLLTGGGEGVGPLYQQARTLARECAGVRVVIICGRNRRLFRRVTRLQGQYEDRIVVRGFVDNMSEWMRAVDVVATKAGPGTIAEALTCGTALVVTGALPGQEQGNVEEVLRTRSGIYAPDIETLRDVVRELQSDGLQHQELRARAASAARPSATKTIAQSLLAIAEQTQHRRPQPYSSRPRVASHRHWSRTRAAMAGVAALVSICWGSMTFGVEAAAAVGFDSNRYEATPATTYLGVRVDAAELADPRLPEIAKSMNVTVVVDAMAAMGNPQAVRALSDAGVDVANGGMGVHSKTSARWARARNDVEAATLVLKEAGADPHVFVPSRRLDGFDVYYSRRAHEELLLSAHRVRMKMGLEGLSCEPGAFVLDGRDSTPSALHDALMQLGESCAQRHVDIATLDRLVD